MDEARSFLRYVIPGLLFVIETILGLWLVLPNWTLAHITPLFSEKNSLVSAITGILVSGVLGHIFATAHHWCRWTLPLDRDVSDDRQVAAMVVQRHPSAEFSNDSEDKLTALQIAGAYWFKMRLKDQLTSGAHAYLDSFGDLAHGAGAARVASVAALATVIITCAVIARFSYELVDVCRWLGMVLAGFLLCWLFHDAYRRLMTVALGIFGRVVEEELGNEA